MTRRTRTERLMDDMANASDGEVFAVVVAGLQRLSVPSLRLLSGEIDPLILALLRGGEKSASEGEE